MTEPDRLERLAALAGLGSSYEDAWGQRREVPRATHRALLAAMGFPVATEDEIAQAIASLTEMRSGETLPPVLVLPVSERTITLPVVLRRRAPAAGAGARRPRLHWTLEIENAGSRTGAVEIAALALADTIATDAGILERRILSIPASLPPGYHRLTIRVRLLAQEETASTRLIVVPERCYLPPALADQGRRWGFAIQLYGLRSDRNWGIGDFTDLVELIRGAARLGAAAIGLNPLHALFPERPGHASPYSPSSRLFTNLLYLDVEATEDYRGSRPARRFVASPEFQARLRALRAAATVDYEDVAACKMAVLELLYRSFRELRQSHLDQARAEEFERFKERGGQALHRLALFQALAEEAARSGPRDWHDWARTLPPPDSPEIAEFVAGHAERIELYAYLQWQAEKQLAHAAEVARRIGMSVGLYQDLAVGADGSGAEAWDWRDLIIPRVHIGAPPDPWNLKGQDWGLRPFNPIVLRERAYAPFIALLRANMRRGGALRIDHILGLMRLYWIPAGASPTDGCYVAYPWRELLGILALESHRNRCLVIGEDLGTVPAGLREALWQADILSYRLFYFEKDAAGHFRPPADYPAKALVAISTHDLPTFPAYWQGADIGLRDRLALWPTPAHREREAEARARDRAEIARLAREREPAAATTGETAPPVEAVYAHLAETPCRLLMVQLEDLIGQVEQRNVPGTTDQYPNWRQRLPLALAALIADPRVRRVAARLNALRGDRLPLLAATTPAIPAAALAAQPQASAPPTVPRATYRIQFSADFTFDDGIRIVPYLAALGVSHLYASPWLKARPRSPHGYDITDHNSFNPEIGDARAFAHLAEALGEYGIGHILDFVPNHMGIGKADNDWWLDVLEWGEASPYAGYFDIDWDAEARHLRRRVLLPLLGDHYGRILEAGELTPRFDPSSGRYSVWYHEHRFPIAPRDYPTLIRSALAAVGATSATDGNGSRDALARFAAAFEALSEDRAGGSEEIRRRTRNLQAELAELAIDDPRAAECLARSAAGLAGRPGEPESFKALHRLLERQHYRLAYWGVAADEINYRRFFNINELAGIRIENAALFDEAHALIGRLLAEGRLHGLRIDHIDGLFHPEDYCARLQALAARLRPGAEGLYVVVEKILARHERLREEWRVAGTTGYDFLAQLNGLFVDPRHEAALTRLYRRFSGREIDYDDLAYEARQLVMETMMGSELRVLARDLHQISEGRWQSRDYTLEGLRVALREIVACFPVYRTYVTESGTSAEDRRDIAWAVSQARKRWKGPGRDALDFAEAALTTDLAREGGGDPGAITRFAMKFQQYTGPVAAKGIEDTVFYRFHRLSSLCEVGSDPRQFGVSPAAFHHLNQERLRRWRHGMLATATHDTKRGEDARARINALSELPQQWAQRASRWASLNRRKKTEVDGRPAPSRNDEYLLYQTLLGAWPAESAGAALEGSELAEFVARITGYMRKAVREAKERSSWANPHQDYEAALESFVARILDPKAGRPFLGDFLPFQARIAGLGMLSGLVQTALKLTCPGVPDIYQGAELWDLSLVDPDNRRPVDFGRRAALLAGLAPPEADGDDAAAFVRGLRARWPDGGIKLYLVRKLLDLRSRHATLFAEGDYVPLEVSGARGAQVVAFARRLAETSIVVAVGRLFAALVAEGETFPLPSAWGDTAILVPEAWPAATEILTGRRLAPREGSLPAGELFALLPVAVLAGGGAGR
ncbi:MAG TPA: malto-oligosyltrehalose synthase [Alphaproteobacteria bacterium]|nr:malto-oligosyltrehalose synthase [Alphaproteobacteria bacterium]